MGWDSDSCSVWTGNTPTYAIDVRVAGEVWQRNHVRTHCHCSLFPDMYASLNSIAGYLTLTGEIKICLPGGRLLPIKNQSGFLWTLLSVMVRDDFFLVQKKSKLGEEGIHNLWLLWSLAGTCLWSASHPGTGSYEFSVSSNVHFVNTLTNMESSNGSPLYW